MLILTGSGDALDIDGTAPVLQEFDILLLLRYRRNAKLLAKSIAEKRWVQHPIPFNQVSRTKYLRLVVGPQVRVKRRSAQPSRTLVSLVRGNRGKNMRHQVILGNAAMLEHDRRAEIIFRRLHSTFGENCSDLLSTLLRADFCSLGLFRCAIRPGVALVGKKELFELFCWAARFEVPGHGQRKQPEAKPAR